MLKKLALCFGAIIASSLILTSSSSSADSVSDASFEDGSLSSWNIGTQTGSLTGGIITGNGTGVTLINSAVTFNASARGAVGSPTLSDGSPNPYYAPAVAATTWSFSPYGTYGVALQPTGPITFDAATTALGLTSEQNSALKTMMGEQAAASGYGSGTPTNAAWITKNVTLSAGTVYTMSWNYIGTDYVPFNDGSITSLVYAGADATPTIDVNNSAGNYALLGFTNPGTGDYSTGTFGSTGWQISTYEVSVTGEYMLGFAVFNLDDTALSPVLLVDSEPGTTLKNGETFGAVAPNNPNAPTVAPTTTTEAPAPTTEAPTTTETPTTTEAPAPTTEVPTTTEAPAPTTTEAPVIVTPDTPAPTTEAPVDTTIEVPTTVETPETTSAPVATLPITGSSDNQKTTAWVGLLFIIAGAVVVRLRRLS